MDGDSVADSYRVDARLTVTPTDSSRDAGFNGGLTVSVGANYGSTTDVDSTENGSDSREPQTKPYEKYYANVIQWIQRKGDEAPQPYSGSERTVPTEQYVTAEIEGLGGTRGWDFEKGFDPEDAESLEPAALQVFEPDTFKIWYTPDHTDENGNLSFVVRASLETGVKTKNVYRRETPNGEVLYVKNRGVPRNSDKQWTYLDKNGRNMKPGRNTGPPMR